MAIPEGRFSLTGDFAPGFQTWLFIVFVMTVVAGYGLVLVRAIRGHKSCTAR